jgi:hypothetical protein
LSSSAEASVDDRRELPEHVVNEVLEVAPHPRLDRGDLLADGGAPLLDRARLAGEVLLEEGRCGALSSSLDIMLGAASGVDALRSSAAASMRLAEGVVEQDAAPLLGEEAW